jgi:two-component system phosphate regulon sensor histidine kinase PhoR
MRKPRLAVRTFVVIIAVSAVAMMVMAGSSALSMRKLYHDATLSTLLQTATALANDASLYESDDFCSRVAAGTSLRVTLIAPDGTVLGDSVSAPGAMDNHAGRPEIASALLGEPATSMRNSPTLGMAMAYAAAPLRVNDRITGVIRVAMAASELGTAITPFILASVAIAAAMMATMALASSRIGASVAGPMKALMDAASDWSAGRLERRVKRFEDPELGPLADTMNAMAAELAGRIIAMERQKRELGAILDGMGEAVLSTDADLVIRLANPKARSLLGRAGSTQPFEGLSLLQATGTITLDELARRCAARGHREEAEITLYGDDTRHLLANAEPISLEDGRSGVVLVLNDITRLKRLERVRKDFVANVSHELRTPITLIKGFAETLEDVDDPVEARHFLGIVKRHADRMSAIIEDLLSLARLEGPEQGSMQTARTDAALLLDHAVESLGRGPQDKAVSIVTTCETGLAVRANEGLLEQALVNLLDNAVKYGPRGATIRAEATTEAGFARFSIIDEGPGIPARDLGKLFERFYRVDRARSRELGGTGLGLAIVRHIALAHGGDASVTSKEGSGSSFIIRIPLWMPSGPDSVQTGPSLDDTSTQST